MPSTSLNDIKAAIITLLRADGTLAALVSGVYDEVPQGTAYPYIAVGSMTEVRFNAFGKAGKDTTVTLHVWSQNAGFKEALAITDRVNVLLDNTALSVSGFNLVLCEHENTNTIIDPDGKTRQVAIGYRVIVQE